MFVYTSEVPGKHTGVREVLPGMRSTWRLPPTQVSHGRGDQVGQIGIQAVIVTLTHTKHTHNCRQWRQPTLITDHNTYTVINIQDHTTDDVRSVLMYGKSWTCDKLSQNTDLSLDLFNRGLLKYPGRECGNENETEKPYIIACSVRNNDDQSRGATGVNL